MTEFAGIYRALNTQGIRPWEADALEIWQVGALLGVDLPPAPETDERESRASRLRMLKQKAVERGLIPA